MQYQLMHQSLKTDNMKLLWMNFRGDGLTDQQNKLTELRINDVLNSWMGTKHVAGQRCKGSGIDCVQLVAAFIDEMNNKDLGFTSFPRLPQSTGMTDKTGVKGAPIFNAITNKNPTHIIGRMLQPGDIVVCKSGRGGGPGHAMIVSAYENKLVHACSGGGGVVFNGIGSMGSALHSYRLLNRINWYKGEL